MTKKPILNIIGAIIISITCLNIANYLIKNKKSFQILIRSNLALKVKSDYLERCLKYGLNIDKDKISLPPDIKIIVYLSGKVCPSCIEKLLHSLKKFNKTGKSTLILINDISKLDFIIDYNDVYQSYYQYLYDTTKLMDPVNEILVLKISEGEIKCVLEYKPLEEEIFEKYFNLMFMESDSPNRSVTK